MDKAIILNKEEEGPSVQDPPEVIRFGKCIGGNKIWKNPKPKPPLARIMKEGVEDYQGCPKCGSTLIRRFGFLRILGCIQSECENYYKRKKQ